MKGKDFKEIYENIFSEYLEKIIIELEDLYKKFNNEGFDENFAYNSCLEFLQGNHKDIKLINTDYKSLNTQLRNRSNIVRNNNLNIFYKNIVLPACSKSNLEMNDSIFKEILKELAVLESLELLESWFRNWSKVYGLMYRINNFSEFKIIRNSDSYHNSELFLKYSNKVYGDTDKIKNFYVKPEFKNAVELLYNPLTNGYIIEDLTSFEDFCNVLIKSGSPRSSKIYFSCNHRIASYFLFKLKFFMNELSFASIGKSGLFISENGKPFKEDHLSKSNRNIDPEEEDQVNDLLNSVGLFITD